MLQPLMPQVISDTSQKDVNKHLARFAEQFNASMMTAVIPVSHFREGHLHPINNPNSLYRQRAWGDPVYIRNIDTLAY